MKNIKKVIVSAMAAVMAAAALATTAGAAEYVSNDGSYWYDGTNDSRIYMEDYNGSWYEISSYTNSSSYNSSTETRRNSAYTDYTSYNNGYNYCYNNTYTNVSPRKSSTYTETTYTESCMGYDDFYGYVYYRADCGYYTKNGKSRKYLGQSFTFTQYIGKDRSGRKIYYRSEYGYIYYSGKGTTWYTLGYNINNIAW